MTDETLFHQALSKPPAERAAFLDSACKGQPELRAAVDGLLSFHEASGAFLDKAPVEANPLPAPSDFTDFIQPKMKSDVVLGGRYSLLEKIGEGGMGEVWVARQSEPVKRRVALKLIKTGMDLKAVLARFEQERQALGMMDHPNIARVLDGGMTPTGQPYFVMELVNGLPLIKYCDDAKLTPRERLELFVPVCQAVQHAHQKGIIHRDLKPANILVTEVDGTPVPKVIDFGVAKATAGKLTDESMFTQFGAVVGTLEYMAPEQAGLSSTDIDTRADIYSLGVILYELLTGLKPIDAKRLKSTALLEMIRVIKEEEPAKPSTRLSTDKSLPALAASRQTDPKRLTAMLRGDLDCVVMKCLEKNRSRRYETANGLAADIRRHLANEPVVARPPSIAYRTQKAWQRNRLAFSAAAAVAVALIIGIAASISQAVRADREATRSAAALNELRATAPAFAEQARGLASKEQFEEAIEKLDYAIKLRPDVPDYLVAKGDLLECQFKLAAAAANYREALRIKPRDARAEASAKLCDELLAAKPGEQGKLSRESLAKLHLAMQEQQRPTAELMPVARLLGEAKKHLLDYWLARLKDLPVSTEKPLKERLTIRDDGRLALDLSDTKVVDLSPLAGAPLAVLNVSGVKQRSELTDLSPLRGIDLLELNINYTGVSSLAALRDMHSLEKLDITGTKVTELAPLSALRLKHLTFMKCAISDLTPIRKMPLEEIYLRETRVADLSPLIGMPIKTIDLTQCPVLDFSPLSKLPLEKCYVQHSRITDLSILRGLPLKELVIWGCADARNYAVLAEIKTLELLLLNYSYRDLPDADYEAIGALRKHPKLRQIGAEIMDQMGYTNTGSAEIFWADWDREQAFVPALRKSGIKFTLMKRATGSYYLSIDNQPLRDLSLIKNAPIAELRLSGCPCTDLAPLHDMKLDTFHLTSSVVTDISALRGMPLKELYLNVKKLEDLSPLVGLPIKDLFLENCENLPDVDALAGISSLENLTLPMQAGNIENLRGLPRLQRLGFNRIPASMSPDMTVEEFWKANGPDCWMTRLRETGFKRTVIAKPTAKVTAKNARPAARSVRIQSLKHLDDGTWEVNLSDSAIRDLSILKGAPISRLLLSKTAVDDLAPLRGMAIKYLKLDNTLVADLSPLQEMPLEELNLEKSKVTDIAPLRGMSTLKSLALGGTAVSSLEPLRGLPLDYLNIYGTLVTDLAPLQGALITSFSLSGTNVRDISALRGLPIKSLNLTDCKQLFDISPLGDFPELTQLNLPPNAKSFEFLRNNTRLERISFNADSQNGYRPNKTAEEFWRDYGENTWARQLRAAGMKFTDRRDADGLWTVTVESKDFRDCSIFKDAPIRELHLADTAVSNLAPLRGLPLTVLRLARTKVIDLSPLQGMKLEELILSSGKVTDITPLRGLPIKLLDLGGLPIPDIDALRGMPLTHLWIYNTRITDLRPIEKAPLEYLNLANSKVADVSPLRGMGLQSLKLHDCIEPIDLAPLAEIKSLTDLTLPPNAKNVEKLRAMPALEFVGYKESKAYRADKTAAEFWKEYEENTWGRVLTATGIKHSSSRNPDGTWAVTVESKEFSDCSVFKGAPIRWLTLSKTAVADLTPLRDSALKHLTINETKVSDLRHLQGMQLETLNISGTAVVDLEPLRGMSLNYLNVTKTNVTDLSPVAKSPIENLNIGLTKIVDLSPLRNMPLTILRLQESAVVDLSPLAGNKTLTQITLPSNVRNIEILRRHPKLEYIGYVEEPKNNWLPDKTAAEFWKEYDDKNWARALDTAGIKHTEKREADGTWHVTIKSKEFSDCSVFKGAPISSLYLAGTAVVDLVPLRGMALRKLNLYETKVADLSPLKNMPLEELILDRTPVVDFTVLKGMPLQILSLGSTSFADLNLLRGMQLKSLTLWSTPVTDIRPLEGMPLESLWLNRQIGDLSVLRGMPLTNLKVHDCPEGTDLSPLAEIKTLTNVTISPAAKNIQLLRALHNLERIGFKEDWKNGGRPDKTAAEFWRELDGKKWSKPLDTAGIKYTATLDAAGLWAVVVESKEFSDCSLFKGAPIVSLNLSNTSVMDLTPLRGMALKTLWITGTKVTDLSPLKGMPLAEFHLHYTNVTDFSILRGMRLKVLELSNTAFADLELLRGMPLERLWLSSTPVTDLSALKGMPLVDLTLFKTQVTDLSVLRGMPLKKLNLDSTPVSNLGPIEALSLVYLNLQASRVTDLAPLRSPALSQNLTVLNISGLKATDYSAVAACTHLEALHINSIVTPDLGFVQGLKLTTLETAGAQVTDISALAGMPLATVRLENSTVTDISPLLKCPTLKSLTLPQNARDVKALRALPALAAVSYEYKSNPAGPAQTAAQFWKEYDEQVWQNALRASDHKITSLRRLDDGSWEVDLSGSKLSDLSIIRGAPISRLSVNGNPVADLSPLRGMKLKTLRIGDTKVSDISVIKGMPLEELELKGVKAVDLSVLKGMQLWYLGIGSTNVSDLTPLRGMPLKQLKFYNTKVADLAPLEGMKLELLQVSGSKVTDLSMVRGMPLTILRLHGCNDLIDLSPVVECKELLELTLPPNAKDILPVRALPKLKFLSFAEAASGSKPDKTAQQFWKEYDAKKK